MTRGRAATPDPFDLCAVNRSDELFDGLSARRLADPAAEADDPALRLLAALAADVDVGAPPLPASARVVCSTPRQRRRGVGAVITFGVAAIVLASAGAAAAGASDGTTATGPAHHSTSERSNANHQTRTSERPDSGAAAPDPSRAAWPGPVPPGVRHDPEGPGHRPPTADPRQGVDASPNPGNPGEHPPHGTRPLPCWLPVTGDQDDDQKDGPPQNKGGRDKGGRTGPVREDPERTGITQYDGHLTTSEDCDLGDGPIVP